MGNKRLRLRINRFRELFGVFLSTIIGIIASARRHRPTKKHLLGLLKRGARVLSLELGGLGDTVMSIAGYRAFIKKYPRSSLIIIAKQANAAVLKLAGINYDHIPWNSDLEAFIATKPHIVMKAILSFLRETIKVSAILRKKKIQVALIPHHDIRIALLALLSGAPFRVGHSNYFWPGDTYRYPWRGILTHSVLSPYRSHYSESRRSLFKYLQVEVNLSNVDIRIPYNLLQQANNLLRKRGWDGKKEVLVIHPGARRKIRIWPSERFIEVGKWATTHGIFVCVLVGPEETELGQQIHEGIGQNSCILAPSLEEAMAILSKAKLCVCNDSAAAHLANAVGTPTVILFSVNLPQVCRPCGETQSVAIEAEFPCKHRPCHFVICPSGQVCVQRIDIERVINACQRFILQPLSQTTNKH